MFAAPYPGHARGARVKKLLVSIRFATIASTT
jgi:hypothetical protein